MSVVPVDATRTWAGVAGRAVHRSLVFATPMAAHRRSRRFDAVGVPTPSRSPAMGAHVALDELVVGGFHAVNRPIPSEEIDRIEREADAALAHFTDAGWLADPRSYHRDPSAPAEVALGRKRVGRTRFETLRFDSGWEPQPGEPGRSRWVGQLANHRVRALVLRHDDGPRPWVICIHGAEMGGRPLIDTRILRAEHLHRDLGLNVALPVLPLHGPRRAHGVTGSPTLPAASGFPGLDLVDDVHGLAQSAWDIRRLVAWIRTQDATGHANGNGNGNGIGNRIGITGFSLGGYVAALVAALEPTLDVVVAGCPAVDLPSLFRRSAPAALRHDPRFLALLQQADQLLPVVSPLALPAAVPADRSYIYAGLVDRLAHPVEQAAELARHWGDPHVLWFAGGHITHSFNGEVATFVDDALRMHLA